MAYTKTVWENLPSTNTPLNAENLNNIEDGIETIDNRLSDEEVYKTATAGSNGDFHVTLTNTTLTNGRTVKVSFPAATNGASNARLSIDGGTNYVNILNHIGKNLSNTRQDLVFNETDFKVVNEPNTISVGISTDYTTLSTAEEKLPINTIFQKSGDKLSLSANGVLINAGVSRVKVSSNVMYSTVPAGGLNEIHANNIYINTTKVGETGIRPVGSFPSVSLSTRIFNVTPGDIIFLYVRSAGASGSVVRNQSTFTNLTVEVIE